MMVVFFIGLAAALLVVGAASDTTQIFVGLSLIGFFASIYHPVGIAWLVAGAKRQGMTLGINGVTGGIGGALSAPFVGAMIDDFTWRHAFVIPGVVSLLIGLVLLILWRTGRMEDLTRDRVPPKPPSRQAMKTAFIVLTLTMACAGFVYSGVTNTMPKLFELGLDGLATSFTDIGLYVGAVLSLIHI